MPIVLDGSLGVTTPMYNGTITANAVTPSVNMKNRIINGAMTISQRGTSFSTTTITNGDYTLDRWYPFCNSASFSGSVAQSTTAPIGFGNSYLFTNTTGVTVGSTDAAQLTQAIEGYNWYDLGYGTADAKTVTLSFWVRCSLTGQFGGSLQNYAGTRSYPFSYTISSANTFEYKTITITGDTGGTWVGASNDGSAQLNFDLGMGSSKLGTAGAWSASNLRGATGDTKIVATSGATFYITGVQLEVGSTATSFDYRPYGTELGLCYRYCYALYKGDNIYYATAGYYTSTDLRTQIQMPVNMRTTPTISYTGYSQVWRNGTSDANNVNGWSVTLSCPNTVHLTSTNSMSGTAGQIGWLYGAGGGQLIFLAEL